MLHPWETFVDLIFDSHLSLPVRPQLGTLAEERAVREQVAQELVPVVLELVALRQVPRAIEGPLKQVIPKVILTLNQLVLVVR